MLVEADAQFAGGDVLQPVPAPRPGRQQAGQDHEVTHLAGVKAESPEEGEIESRVVYDYLDGGQRPPEGGHVAEGEQVENEDASVGGQLE